MKTTLTTTGLMAFGLSEQEAHRLNSQLQASIPQDCSAKEAWKLISQHILSPDDPFTVHLGIYQTLFPDWRIHPEHAPAWIPTVEDYQHSHLFHWMVENNQTAVSAFHRWSVENYSEFWHKIVDKLAIVFHKPPKNTVDLSAGIETPHWFPDATLNIAESCFLAPPQQTALLFLDEQGDIVQMTYGELNRLSNRIANSLLHLGYKQGDVIGICMPMHAQAIAIYLGIIKIGGIVASIADSFSQQEIQLRLHIAKAKALFTQDVLLRADKSFPLYEKIGSSPTRQCIVLPCKNTLSVHLQEQDCSWDTFLISDDNFTPIAVTPSYPCNILFSSGTTGEPKAIAWDHTTAIKAASDAYLHHNVQNNDIFSWPTNLGWMMGPWLIFATLINQATIALYTDTPKERAFGEFISKAQVTILGVVPTLVAHWRETECMQNLDWQHIRLFSSTGECSNPEDMLYLMSRAGYKPVIEYCGGTEIGGAYITSTLIQENIPSHFSTKAMGLDFCILADQETNVGEVALIPPSIGLSTHLLNANHHQIYYAHMPMTTDGKQLRRHGDQIKEIANGYYCILGRSDDTMNLGGIKVSAAEIERAMNGIPHIAETAAIAISRQGHGPSQLVIYASSSHLLDKNEIMVIMQKRVNTLINPLFRLQDVVLVNELPKTASNKIMRRVLRDEYLKLHR